MFMTKSLRGRRLVVGFALGAVLATAGCDSAVEQASNAAASSGPVQDGGTLTVAQSTDAQPESFLQPAVGNIVSEYAVFETLTLLDTKTGQPKGVLADSWNLAADGLSMDLKLRNDVKFHTGRQLTSADVIYTLKLVQDPKNAVGTRSIAEQISNIEATGDYGLKLTFKRPLPGVFDLFETMPIVDKDTFADYKAGKTVVGTGRFRWKSWTPGGQIVLEKNPDYRDAKNTHLDKIEIQIIKDSTALVSALKSGRVQYAAGMPALDANTLGAQPGYKLVLSGGSALPLVLDVTKPPFDNQKVRQAVQFAIDRDRIVKQVEGGQADANALPWKSSVPGYDASQGKLYPYQPDKAKQLLTEAGVAGTTFTVVVPNIPESVAIFEIVQNNLAAVGLTAKSEVIATPDYDKRIAQRSIGGQAVLMRIGNAQTPATAVVSRSDLIASNNVSHFSTPDYTKLTEALSVAVSSEDQKKALTAWNAYFLDQAFAVPVLTRSTLSVQTTGFDGLAPTSQGFLDLSTAYLTKK